MSRGQRWSVSIDVVAGPTIVVETDLDELDAYDNALTLRRRVIRYGTLDGRKVARIFMSTVDYTETIWSAPVVLRRPVSR